jgi:hypothetical protein
MSNLQAGEIPDRPRCLSVVDIAKIEPELGRQQIVVPWDGDERMVRQKLRDKQAKY